MEQSEPLVKASSKLSDEPGRANQALSVGPRSRRGLGWAAVPDVRNQVDASPKGRNFSKIPMATA